MNEDEKKVLNSLAEAHIEFCKLTSYHPSDQGEWTTHIHALQNIVMARAAVRTDPDFFTNVSVT